MNAVGFLHYSPRCSRSPIDPLEVFISYFIYVFERCVSLSYILIYSLLPLTNILLFFSAFYFTNSYLLKHLGIFIDTFTFSSLLFLTRAHFNTIIPNKWPNRVLAFSNGSKISGRSIIGAFYVPRYDISISFIFPSCNTVITSKGLNILKILQFLSTLTVILPPNI